MKLVLPTLVFLSSNAIIFMKNALCNLVFFTIECFDWIAYGAVSSYKKSVTSSSSENPTTLFMARFCTNRCTWKSNPSQAKYQQWPDRICKFLKLVPFALGADIEGWQYYVNTQFLYYE
jgi:hypothetical protein